ncbi:MAG: hypothetical protein AB8W37_12920 [Arsenophonus endosymbiont of Dermacentor nuttalli]
MVTTHFMDEDEYCDRIGLVYHGKIIASGTPDQLKSQIATAEKPDPLMEEAFIGLILNYDQGLKRASNNNYNRKKPSFHGPFASSLY